MGFFRLGMATVSRRPPEVPVAGVAAAGRWRWHPGGDQGRVLAQRVPPQPSRCQPPLVLKRPKHGDLGGEDGGLGVLGQVQARIVGEAERRHILAQRRAGLREHGAGDR